MMRFYAPGPNGKMIQVKESSGTTDERAARNKLKDRLAAIRLARKTGSTVELPVNRRVTVAELLDAHLADLRHREAKGLRNEEYRLGKDSPLRTELGRVLASAVSHATLVAYCELRRKRDKSSNATVSRDMEGLHASFKLGVRTGRIFRVPPFPEKLKGRVRQGFYNADEVERLVKNAEPWLGEMIRFAFATGWRRGELFGLRWEWVDLEEMEIRLPDSKNGQPRIIPIVGELVPIIDRLKEARKVTRKDKSVALAETVFHANGHPITKKIFSTAWAAARKEAKLPGRLFHDFRRAAARRLTNAGVPQVVAMKLTGHRTPSMYRRYSIVETADLATALNTVAGKKEKPSGGTLAAIRRLG
jgi:integrase